MPSASPTASQSPLSPRLSRSKTGGFSIVELLTVLAIIGILASIVVPLISGVNGDADEVRHRRNAQNLANVFATGEIAGAKFLAPGNLERTISNVATGTTIDSGVFNGHLFSVPGLTAEDRAEAARYLVLERNHLAYNPGA